MDFFLNPPKSPKLVIYQIFFQRTSFLDLLQFLTRYIETHTNISKENNKEKIDIKIHCYLIVRMFQF
jgi:hypothetical protein